MRRFIIPPLGLEFHCDDTISRSGVVIQMILVAIMMALPLVFDQVPLFNVIGRYGSFVSTLLSQDAYFCMLPLGSSSAWFFHYVF